MIPLTMTQEREQSNRRVASSWTQTMADIAAETFAELDATRAKLAEAEAQRNDWRDAALDYLAVSVKLQASEARCAALVEALVGARPALETSWRRGQQPSDKRALDALNAQGGAE